MKALKLFFFIPILTFLMMSFSQCSGKQLDKKPPVTITQSFYQTWVGGVPGAKGTLVTINLTTPDKEILFDSIYFNGDIVKLKTSSNENGTTLTGNFTVSKKQNDIIMDGDPEKEFGNTPTKRNANIPKKKTRYFKLTGIKKTKSLFYQ